MQQIFTWRVQQNPLISPDIEQLEIPLLWPVLDHANAVEYAEETKDGVFSGNLQHFGQHDLISVIQLCTKQEWLVLDFAPQVGTAQAPYASQMRYDWPPTKRELLD